LVTTVVVRDENLDTPVGLDKYNESGGGDEAYSIVNGSHRRDAMY
jgi:hypothetical protein